MKTFTRVDETWYGKGGVPEFMLAGETDGEFAVRLVSGVGRTIGLRLEVFGDGVHLLTSEYMDLVHFLGGNEDATPEELQAWLISCGVKDVTPRKGPV